MDDAIRTQAVLMADAAGGQPTADLLTLVIEGHAADRGAAIKAMANYRGDKDTLPILNRTLDDTDKVNARLANDFRGLIVDQAVGYLFGRPVTYSVDPSRFEGLGEEALERADRELGDFILRSELHNLDAETGRRAAICGWCGRLCYVGEDGRLYAMLIEPWECVFLSERYALRYYDTVDVEGSELRVAEWYSPTTVSVWAEAEGGWSEVETRPHGFGRCPLVEVRNNDDRRGDFAKVEALIDAYDRTLSDVQSELEQFRLAYLYALGAEMDNATLERMKQTGLLNIPEGSEVGWLVKQIQEGVIEAHKRTVRENIFIFSKTVDMSDEKFSGAAQSGESRKWKLLALENKCASKERAFVVGVRAMFRVLATAWARQGIALDEYAVRIAFGRNLPADLSYEADVTAKLRGMVSERTRLEQLTIVEDVDREIKAMAEEREGDVAAMAALISPTAEAEANEGGADVAALKEGE